MTDTAETCESTKAVLGKGYVKCPTPVKRPLSVNDSALTVVITHLKQVKL